MATMTKPNSGRALRELTNYLWRGGQYAYWWSLSQDGVKETHWFPVDKPEPPSQTWGERHQYFGVHPTTVKRQTWERATNETVAAINCLFADFDAKDEVLPDEYAPFLPDNFDDLSPTKQKPIVKAAQEQAMMLELPGYKARALARMQQCPLCPTWLIDSGGGYQCYWLLADTVIVDAGNRDRLKLLQNAWAEQIGADTGVKDLARVLRMPGSANVKSYFAPNYPIVTVVERDDTRLYTLADFEGLTGVDDVWMAAKDAKPPKRDTVGDSIIAQFNEAVKVGDLLTQRGYQLGKSFKGIERYSRPGRDKGQTSVVVWTESNRSYHHSSSDALYCGDHSRDAYDVFTQLEHGGDGKAAYMAAKKELGLWEEQPTQSNSNGAMNDNATLALLTAGAIDDSEPEGAHPLDIHPKKRLELGWIDRYADLMTQMTGAPREFNRLAGLAIVATAIQRRARLRMSFGDIYPNVYAAVIAPSSVYHKSSALAKPRAMLQRAMLDNLLLSELMTSEGLLKQLQGQPAGLVLRDEIGTLFASHNTKYLANLKPDLTALFDCYPYSRRLSNDDVKVPSPYLNILGATTPSRFFEGVSFIDWQDGFLARWLFVMPEKEPDFDAMTGLFTNEHDAQVGALATTLMNIDRQRETDFELVSPAFTLWDAWQRQAAKDAYYYGDDVTAAIVTRYAAYALKFAMILAAVNDSWGTITPETMQTAIDLADSFKATVYKLLSMKSNYGVSGAKLQKVFRVIKGKAGAEGITQREIGRLCHMRKAELTPCMEKLIAIGAVMAVESGKAERFIPAVENLPAKTW
jgi:hypothetical protein